MLVDDHAVVRAGFRLVLHGAPGITVVGEAGTEERAIVMARAHQPDVIVLDVFLPERSGIELIAELLEVSPQSKVLMLSSSAEPGTVERALEAGATGYSIKRATDTDLIAAVQAVASGSNYVHPELGAALATSRKAATGPLSPRELDVLRLVAEGLSNTEIATRLVLTENTVKSHVAHLLGKLGLRDRVQAVVLAYQTGFAA